MSRDRVTTIEEIACKLVSKVYVAASTLARWQGLREELLTWKLANHTTRNKRTLMGNGVDLEIDSCIIARWD